MSLLEKRLFCCPAHLYTGFLLLLLLSCCCLSSLCILDINPLADTLFASIFSHSVGCLFVALMVSFAVHKRLSFTEPLLLIFAFVSFSYLET